MTRMEKEINNIRTFQTRFREQYNKKYRTQSELGDIFGVSRQTVATWLNGDSIPDCLALKKIAEFYNVSADYLLGISDMVSPDVNLRAAAEYTGLSEEAVEHLHNGLINYRSVRIRRREDVVKQHLSMASTFIKCIAFVNIVHCLSKIAKDAYCEQIMRILYEQYSERTSVKDNSRLPSTKENCEIVRANLLHVLEIKTGNWNEQNLNRIKAMGARELDSKVSSVLFSCVEANELHQFHATKALSSCIDEVIRQSQEKAKQRFVKK